MKRNHTFSWMAASLKVVFLGLFIWLTNTGVVERIVLLLDQERLRAVVLYAGLWGGCIACLLIAAFHPRLRWRLFWGAVIAATTFAGYLFMRVSGSQMTVFHAISLWSATADAGRAFTFYQKDVALAAAVAVFGLVVFAAKPPALRPWTDKLMRVLSLAPAGPVLALVLMIMFRIGNDTVAMPQQFTPLAIGTVAAINLASYELPEKAGLTEGPERPPAIRHVVLIIDESIGADVVALKAENPVTPYLQSIRNRIVDFGVASSVANCSSSSNAILRYGGGQRDLRVTLKDSPYLWSYARKAGFRTVYLDAGAQNIKNTDTLQNFMTLREAALIDEFVTITGGAVPLLDRKLSQKLAEVLSRPEPQFVYVNKNGSHFPYDDSYPAEQASFAPAERDASGPVTQIHRKNSYLNAVQWSVDGFFKDFLARISLYDTALIYTSDHGQNLTLGRLTHCSPTNADPAEGRVPLMFFSDNTEVRKMFEKGAAVSRDRASQFAIFPTLLELFGYDAKRLGSGYGGTLFVAASDPQDFVSGDVFGMFGKDLNWNAIDNKGVPGS